MLLRPYQQEAVDASLQWFAEGKDRPLVVLPTGTGKSVVIADLCRDVLSRHAGTRIVICVHVKELVQQNYDKLMAVWPNAPAGIYSAGIGRREHQAQILFCGIQSVYKKAALIGHVDLLIGDEVHLIPRKGDGMWRTFEKDLRTINQDMAFLGLTATPYRLDTGLIIQGDNPQFDGVCYQYSVIQAIKDGYLSEIVSAPVQTHLKTEGVKKRGGEFIAGDLERAVDTDEQTAACCDEIISLGKDRKTWLIFAAGNTHAQHIHEYLQRQGLTGHVVTQETSKSERSAAISQLMDGRCRYVVNNMILTTGFDCPRLDLIACMRPTQSAGLWVQMLGRGMRLFPSKENCMLLDFGRNLDRHGPVDKISGTIYEAKEKDGEAPIKQCLKCFAVCHAAVRLCPDCGFEFPENEVTLSGKPSTGAVFSFQKQEPVMVDVLDMKVSRHTSRTVGKPDTMRVRYTTLGADVSEFICYDHPKGSYAFQKAIAWGGYQENIDEALKINWTMPNKISIIKEGKYWKVIERDFSKQYFTQGGHQ